jgi:hypothetical protein
MHNEGLKQAVLALIDAGKTYRQVSEMLNVGLGSINRWRTERDSDEEIVQEKGYWDDDDAPDEYQWSETLYVPEDTPRERVPVIQREYGTRVLCIGDIHAPVTKKGYLEFVQAIQKKYRTNETVFIGDVVDNHAISFYANHPDAPGSGNEHQITMACLEPWKQAFPNATVTIGNHDARINRVANSVNIPSKFLRSYAEIWQTPGWQWVDDIIIDNVYYCHGTGRSGLFPAYNCAKEMGMSSVMGHCHSVAGIKWMCSPEKRWFGCDTGCGIDDKAYAFAYGQNMKKKSMLSCAVVIDGVPYLEPFFMEKYK